MRKQKDPIRLRSREVAGGNRSLYLDTYCEGRRSYEYLHLYLIPEKNAADREKNRKTEQLAKAILAKRIVEFQNGRFGFENTTKGGVDFFAFANKITEDFDKKQTGTRHIYRSTIKKVAEFTNAKSLPFRDIDKEWLEGFMKSLKEAGLGNNTINCYWRIFMAIMNRAVRKGIVNSNPCKQLDTPRRRESERTYLTIDELRKMAATPCRDKTVKRAFLFSCLTGLRKSDIEQLTWGEVAERPDGTARITFRQKKTGGLLYQDVGTEARGFMGERGDADSLVFAGFKYERISKKLQTWAKTAWIDKPLTYHCCRHTFALLLLDQSTDIYTVSKLLGHTDVKTTQLYAHILDKKKQAAIASLPSITTIE